MNKRNLFVFGLAMLMLCLMVLPALASQPFSVGGKLAYAGPPSNLEWRPAGNNCIIDVDVPYVFYDGNLNGLASTHFRVVSHGACTADVPANPFENNESLKASGTFVGSVDGKEGSFDFTYEARAWPADPGDLALTGRIVILSGYGELANLHGVLKIDYVMGEAYDTYTGQIHFDP
jgi:hypothetical protein